MKANRRLLGTLAAVCGLFIAGNTSAKAQDPEAPVPHTLSVKLGAFVPTQGTLKNQSSSPYYGLGFEYDPNFRYKLGGGGNITFGLDFLYRGNGGLKYLTIPITVRSTWTLSKDESKIRTYGGMGLGLYIINTGFIGATTQPGAKFILGADITHKYFVELNYDYIAGFNDNLGNSLRADGLTLWLGIRR